VPFLVFLDPAKRNDFHLAANTIAEVIACMNMREGLTRDKQRSLVSAVPYKVYRTYTPEKRRQLHEEREAASGGSGKKKQCNDKPKQHGINSVGRDDDANSMECCGTGGWNVFQAVLVPSRGAISFS
jgi:hypothetical protein